MLLSLLLRVQDAHADYQALATLSGLIEKASSAGPCPLLLTATGVVENGTPKLRFVLTNTSTNRLSLEDGGLPWEGPYGVTIAALDESGRQLEIGYPISDTFGPPSRKDIAPGQILRGTYDLMWRLTGRDIHVHARLTVLWAYPVRIFGAALKQQPMCTGIASIRIP